MSHLSRFLLLFIMPLVVLAAEPDDREGVLVDGGWFDCLPIATFGLNGLIISDPEDSIRKVLGEPQSVSTGWSEDDGGRHDVVTYKYEYFEVDAVRGSVDRIFTESEHVSMPSGIHVGHSLDEIIEIFGRGPKGLKPAPTVFQIVTCPVDGEWVREDYVIFRIDSDEKLISIEYAVNRP